MITAAIAATALGAVISGAVTRTSAQAPALKTAWGEPDLQGIWTDESDTPMQRSPRYANQEFFTAEQRAELDRQRSALIGRDRRAQRGTEADVAGAYNAVFTPMKRTGTRTSRVVDPPNGRLPSPTPEAQKLAAAEREFRVALLQSTETCKNKEPACNGGKYDPAPSPRFAELPPRYNTARMNRHYGPEDATLAERCLTGGLPEFGNVSFRRIVRGPAVANAMARLGSRGVAARPRQSGEIPGPGRVGGVGEDDWCGAACHALQRRLQRDHCRSAAREEEVRPQRHQFLRVFAIPFGIAPRRAMLNLQVAPDGPAQSRHPLEEGGEPRLAFRIVSRQAS
jgi:hypothetical protein